MRTTRLKNSGLISSIQGLGCMGMSEFYGATDEAESLRVLAKAVELGVNHFDTSDLYGKGENERLVGRFLQQTDREKILVATKFGVIRDLDSPLGSTHDRELDNSPDYIRKACDASLQRLGIDHVDLYYLHRHDPAVPIEEVVGTLSDLVKAGKIRAIGLSEVTTDILRRAHRIHPISALQSEYSLFSREIEQDILPCCRELGISFLPYSPLGRGILAGRIRSRADLAPDDLRLSAPIFSEENLPGNLAIVDQLAEIAREMGVTAGQIALAWLHHVGDDIIPIPGTKREQYLVENVGAADLDLTDAGLASLDALLAQGGVAGGGKWSTAPQKKAATR